MELEAKEQERANVLALKAWEQGGGGGGGGGGGIGGWGLDEKVQVLDQVLSGVWNLGEAGGKYAKVVKRFERWVSRAWELLEERRKGKGGRAFERSGEVEFVEELGGEWKDECGLLTRKLEAWRDQLKGLGEAEGKSSIGVVVRGVGDLVRGMLVELRTMARIEKEVLAREEAWIREAMDESSSDEGTSTVTAGAVWRIC